MLGPVKRIIFIVVLSLPAGFLPSFLLWSLSIHDDHPAPPRIITDIYEVLWFLLIIPVPLIIPLVGTLFDLAVRPFKPDLSKRLIKGSWLLMVMLMISGFIFTVLWSYWVYGNLYEHFDYIPFLDCSPFCLLIDHGSCLRYYHGMTEGRVYALWSLYVILCWGTATVMTIQTMRVANKSVNRERRLTKILLTLALTSVLFLSVLWGREWFSDGGCTGYVFHYPPETNGDGTNWTSSAWIRVPDNPRWRTGLYNVDVTIEDHDRKVLMRDQVSLARRDVKFETVWTNFSDLRIRITGSTSSNSNPELHYVLDGKIFRKK
jgi:hypothetical protein